MEVNGERSNGIRRLRNEENERGKEMTTARTTPMLLSIASAIAAVCFYGCQGCASYNGEVLRMEDAHSAAISAAIEASAAAAEVQP